MGVAVDRENGTQNRHLVVLWKTSLWKLCLDELGLVTFNRHMSEISWKPRMFGNIRISQLEIDVVWLASKFQL